MTVKSYKQFTEEKKKKNEPAGAAIKKSPQVDKIEKDTEDKEEKYVQSHADKCPRCGQDAEHCTCDEDPWSTNVMFRAPHGKIENEKPKQDFKGEKKKQH